MTWLGFSFLALILWGVWSFLGKVATQSLPAPAVYLLTVSGHLVVVAFILVEGLGLVPWQPWPVAAALGSGLAMAVGLVFFIKALSQGPALVVVPLTALYPAVTVILAWLFLKETLTLRHLVGLVLALAAVWLLSK